MTATMRALRAHSLIGPPGLWVGEIEGPARMRYGPTCTPPVWGSSTALVTHGEYQMRRDPRSSGMELAGVVANAFNLGGEQQAAAVVEAVSPRMCGEDTVQLPN